MAKKDIDDQGVNDKEIDWDDPAAVAAARGDNHEGSEDERNPNRSTEEQEAIDAQSAADAEADAKPKKDGDDKDAEKDGDDTKTDAEADASSDGDTDSTDKDGKDSKKEKMIPKSRLDAKTKQNKDLRDRLANYERKDAEDAASAKNDDLRTVIDGELVEMDAAINKAIADDDMEEATRLRGEVRKRERELWQLDMDESSASTTNEAREQVRLDLTIDHIESTHEAFNPESENYSQDTVNKVQELRNGFVATGNYSPTQALLRAMDFVLPKKDVSAAKDAANDPEKKAAKEEELRKAGLKAATDAANKQPADASKTGDESDSAGLKDEINIDKLTYEDVASLPEATLRRMRGDTPA